MKMRRTVRAALTRWSIVAGLTVALLAIGGGAWFGFTRPAQWTAEAQAVVLPDAGLDPETSAGYYETLSRGQIPATFAEVLNDSGYVRRAENALGVSASDRGTVAVSAVVVPNTALISVTVTAPDARLAEAIAGQLMSDAVKGTSDLAKPYILSQVSGSDGTAVRKGLSSTQYLLLAGFLGLVAGVGVQQMVFQVGLARHRAAAPREQVNGAAPRFVDQPEVAVETGGAAR